MYVADLPTMNGSRTGSRDFLMNLDEVLVTHIAIDPVKVILCVNMIIVTYI